MMDSHQLINELKEEKLYLSSVILAGLSIILFILNVSHRELIVIGSFLFFSIILLFKMLK